MSKILVIGAGGVSSVAIHKMAQLSNLNTIIKRFLNLSFVHFTSTLTGPGRSHL